MKNRLFQRLFLTTAVALTVSMVILFTLLSIFVNSYFARENKRTLTENCETLSAVLTNESDNTTNFYISLNGVMNVVSKAVSGEAFVSDNEGNVFICSCREWHTEKNCIHSKSKIPSDILLQTENGGSYFEVGNLGSRYQRTYYTAAMPFKTGDGEIAGYVFISASTEKLDNLWNKLSKIFIACAAIPISMLFVYLFFETRRLTRPLNLMSEAAVKMQNGDFSVRIPEGGDDEIGDLAKAFNEMTTSLTQLETMRRSFVANVSHELRTPMTTIGGFIDGIIDGTIPPEKQGYYLDIISSETKRLSRLVQSMLCLAKLESGEQKVQPTHFSPHELTCEILLSQEQRIEKKSINIEGLDKGEGFFVDADRDLIYQAVYNLVDNAIKFTPENGTITAEIFADVENRVHLIIRNDGKGINPNNLKFIFDRFYKTDRSRSENKEGTGLGLYIVKTIVDIHGGNVSVRSIPDKYTEFEIIFPKGSN